MNDLDLLIDLHRDAARLGPGGDDETRLAIRLSGLKDAKNLKIADIGCGTGASTRVLARELDGHVTAVDVLPEFLDALERTAKAERLDARISALAAPMEALPFQQDSFDAIWSEGAIYNMGFADGIKAWRNFLKQGGILAVSELIWLTHDRPTGLERYWRQEYPGVATASAKMAILEANGYTPIGYFPLSRRCWLDNYFDPLQQRFDGFLSRHGHSEPAKAIVAAQRKEITLYERFSAYFGYGYFVAQKTPV